ncbi:MAG: plasmid pRiA4b ORF-3 family protein [Planctomycetota bacterium]|nr:plasmid pRiA4b ORF-3 family protein [Planctomycetota bacterium]
MRLSEPTTAYQLKVTFKDIKPPIWRRLLVSDCTMGELHQIIQVAMGWENYHLYAFRIDGREFTHPDMDDGELEMEDAASTMLGDVIAREKQKFVYQYDFGDDWRHEMLVEKIVGSEPGEVAATPGSEHADTAAPSRH